MIRPQTKQTLTHKGGSKRCKKLKQVKETKMRDAILENVIREDLFDRTSYTMRDLVKGVSQGRVF